MGRSAVGVWAEGPWAELKCGDGVVSPNLRAPIRQAWAHNERLRESRSNGRVAVAARAAFLQHQKEQ